MARFCKTCGCDISLHHRRQAFLFGGGKVCPLRRLTKEERIARELPAASSGASKEAARFVIDRSRLRKAA